MQFYVLFKICQIVKKYVFAFATMPIHNYPKPNNKKEITA